MRGGLVALLLLGLGGPVHATPMSETELDRMVEGLTLREKVGQMMMVGFGGTRVNSQVRKWVRDHKVGGVALFARNIESTEQVARFTRGIHDQARAGLPVFIALDQEGGNVVRLKKGATVLPGNMTLGATGSSTLAYVAGQAVGVDLKHLGFNMNLAPVLDVNSNPNNPVIGIRAYGEHPRLVGDLGSWYIRGQQESGVVGVAKHFPGHGDTQSDSHFSMPSIDADIERLRSVELVPFQRAIDAGLDSIMTAHIALPNAAEDPGLPATLSAKLINEELRGRMGFDGIVMTDGLEMRGIVDRYGSGMAAVKAVQAGADMAMILWTNAKKDEVFRSLLRAVEQGVISEERINLSVKRILRVKARRGMFEREQTPLKDVLKAGNRNPYHRQIAERIATEGTTLVRNHADLLPLHPIRHRRVAVMAPPGAFARRMASEENVRLFKVPYVPSRERRQRDVKRIIRNARNADVLVVVAVNRYHISMIRQVMAGLPNIPVTLVSFASPYYLRSLPSVESYVCTYSYQASAQLAAARGILGIEPMRGRLPVQIPGFYPLGHRAERHVATLPLEAEYLH